MGHVLAVLAGGLLFGHVSVHERPRAYGVSEGLEAGT